MPQTTVPQRRGERSRLRTVGLKLAAGIVGASTSAVLVRYATSAEPLAIAFWRCAAGAAALAPFATQKLRGMPRSAFAAPGVAGAFLAVHFATWITSLELTRVAVSVLLVSTAPVFVAAAAWIGFGRRPKPLAGAGIAVAVGGTAVITGVDLGGGSVAGDALALVGAATGAGYVMAGERGRAELGILEYAAATYGVAAVSLLVACVLAGAPLWGYSSGTWLAIAAMVAGPQLLGHTMINLALKDIDATTVSVVVMSETVLATALAFVFLAETPSTLFYPGAGLIFAGIYLVSRARRSEPGILMT